MTSCMAADTCKTKDFSSVARKCLKESIDAASASPLVKATCQKIEASFSSCDFVWGSSCAGELKAFPDDQIPRFEACLNLPCRQSGSCFRGTEDKILRSER